MTMKTPVLSMLLRYINNTHKKDNNYDIASAMLQQYHEIPKLTIHELADACYVSSSSISRFIRMLGFESYPTFREACKQTIGINVDYSIEVSKAKMEDMQPILQRYTNNIKENLDYAMDNFDYAQLERVSDMLFTTQDIAFFGLEFATLLGQHFQSKMAELNKLVKIGNTHAEQLEIANAFNTNGVVIVASLEGGYFYHNGDILDILKEKGVKIVALTMNQNSKIQRNVDELIVCSKYNNNTEGRLSLLYIIEVLLMYYCVNYQMLSV